MSAAACSNYITTLFSPLYHFQVTIFNTNSADECIGKLHECAPGGATPHDGVIINPGGFCKCDTDGPAIATCLKELGIPSIEVSVCTTVLDAGTLPHCKHS